MVTYICTMCLPSVTVIYLWMFKFKLLGNFYSANFCLTLSYGNIIFKFLYYKANGWTLISGLTV
jgi:hypothetical protein